LIESGAINSDETRALLRDHLAPMRSAQIDYLVLGCSHYPYLIPLLRELLPSNVVIIDSGEAVALQTQAVLKRADLLNPFKEKPRLTFWTNADPSALIQLMLAHEGKITIGRKDF